MVLSRNKLYEIERFLNKCDSDELRYIISECNTKLRKKDHDAEQAKQKTLSVS